MQPRRRRALERSLLRVRVLVSIGLAAAQLIESLAVHPRNGYLSHGWCPTKRFDRAAP